MLFMTVGALVSATAVTVYLLFIRKDVSFSQEKYTEKVAQDVSASFTPRQDLHIGSPQNVSTFSSAPLNTPSPTKEAPLEVPKDAKEQ